MGSKSHRKSACGCRASLAGAGIKAMLSQLSDEEIDEILARAELDKSTPYSVLDKAIYKEEILEVRTQGIAYDREEYIEGMIAFAIPINANRRDFQVAMRYAETGVNLEIDLSRGNIERVETDPRDMELYLGGQGTAAKILWDRVPPEVDPFLRTICSYSAPVFCTPHLFPAANRIAVNTFSPQTNLMSHSLMGGFFGPEMKHAGYDKIIIRGKAPDLVYFVYTRRHSRNPRCHASPGKGLPRKPATSSRRS